MLRFIYSFVLLSFLFSCKTQETAQLHSLESPGKEVSVNIGVTESGQPYYSVAFNGKPVIEESLLGLIIEDLDLREGFAITGAENRSFDETWKPVWGEVDEIRENYKELKLNLESTDKRQLTLYFRAFDDGIGFRYEIPEQKGMKEASVLEEVSQFKMTGDHKVWWIPGDWDSNEHVYTTSKVSEIDATPYNESPSPIYTQHIVYVYSVQTPLTMMMADGTHLSIHEAALEDYPAMQLHVEGLTFTSGLIPSANPPVKSVNKMPFKTPWRSIQLSRDAAGLINSKLIYNLNEPGKIEDPSWIKPMKYVGIWWEMHIGKSTWDYSGTQDASSAVTQAKPHGKHGATTENMKRYIDFAAKYGFDGVLCEGWNLGWEDWFGKWQDSVFSFTVPYPDYDIDLLSKYAAEKGVKIIMHHETSSAVTNYESQLIGALTFMNKHGMPAVKTGYVGKIIPKGEWHDGQWMINHYLRVAESAAKHKIMVNSHESMRPTGQHRTWPNWISSEAARGNEFNAWSIGNPPEHETILPFTRILGGPMDYTPGIFETRMSVHNPSKSEVVHTTVAKQLALYVTLYSPLQMAADLPEIYEKRLDAFRFIMDVPVDWKRSIVLHAAVGDHLGIARLDKNSDNWFIGSITDEQARSFELKLDFLEKGKTYEATVYEDGLGADWDKDPYPVHIRKIKVVNGDKISVNLAPGGGTAISLMVTK